MVHTHTRVMSPLYIHMYIPFLYVYYAKIDMLMATHTHDDIHQYNSTLCAHAPVYVCVHVCICMYVSILCVQIDILMAEFDDDGSGTIDFDEVKSHTHNVCMHTQIHTDTHHTHTGESHARNVYAYTHSDTHRHT